MAPRPREMSEALFIILLLVVRVLFLKAGNLLKTGYFGVWTIYFLGKMGIKWVSESLKLPSTLDCQAAHFYILPVYFKT